MHYEYHFYAPGEWMDPKALLKTSEPLPGILVGHRLYFSDDKLPIPDGHHLLITAVEVVVSAPSGTVQRVVTNVFSKTVARATLHS